MGDDGDVGGGVGHAGLQAGKRKGEAKGGERAPAALRACRCMTFWPPLIPQCICHCSLHHINGAPLLLPSPHTNKLPAPPPHVELTSTKPLPICSSSRKDWSLWSTAPPSTLPAQLEQAPARQL